MRKTFFVVLMGITSVCTACAQSYEESGSTGVQIDHAEPGNVIQGQLLLEFDYSVSHQQASQLADQCGTVLRTVTVQPPLMLVQLPYSEDNPDAAVNGCLSLPGLVRAEWNQKRQRR